LRNPIEKHKEKAKEIDEEREGNPVWELAKEKTD